VPATTPSRITPASSASPPSAVVSNARVAPALPSPSPPIRKKLEMLVSSQKTNSTMMSSASTSPSIAPAKKVSSAR
jgi:hypothetical protein